MHRGDFKLAVHKDRPGPACTVPAQTPVCVTGTADAAACPGRHHCAGRSHHRVQARRLPPLSEGGRVGTGRGRGGCCTLTRPCAGTHQHPPGPPARLLNTPHASGPVTYLGLETRVCGGQRLVHRAVLRRNVQGMRRGLFRHELVCKPVFCPSFFLRRRQCWWLAARAAHRDEGLERQIERPSHLGRKGPVTPAAAPTAPHALRLQHQLREAEGPSSPRTATAPPHPHCRAVTAGTTQ